MLLLRSNFHFLFFFKLLDLPFSKTVLHTALCVEEGKGLGGSPGFARGC